MNRTIAIGVLFVLVMMLWQCTQKYVSPYIAPPTGYLVVEGYISGNGPTQFNLSRTIPLPGDTAIPMETGATVQVEGNDQSVYLLTEQSPGIYIADTLPLHPAVTYRLRITTASGIAYLSDFVPFKPTPPIDSISWISNSTGVEIYANTHDPANATRYYQWEYDETWEYHSAEASLYEYDGDTTPVMVISRPPANMIYTCWHNDSSTNIILGSSAKLAADVIYLQPLNLIPRGSQQLSVLYSILVRQYALTDSGYSYLSLMQQNTESLGNIFDPTPSPLTGNIHCLTNASTPVIGYISAGTVQQQRIFISDQQVPEWGYRFACTRPDEIVPLDTTYLIDYFYYGGFIPVDQYIDPMGDFAGWLANSPSCIDCRVQGGITQEPSFWPN
jgi:hypothetical protein